MGQVILRKVYVKLHFVAEESNFSLSSDKTRCNQWCDKFCFRQLDNLLMENSSKEVFILTAVNLAKGYTNVDLAEHFGFSSDTVVS
jgi:hypothetical protein